MRETFKTVVLSLALLGAAGCADKDVDGMKEFQKSDLHPRMVDALNPGCPEGKQPTAYDVYTDRNPSNVYETYKQAITGRNPKEFTGITVVCEPNSGKPEK